jgi:FAD/FMN-containing dehydrogenase
MTTAGGYLDRRARLVEQFRASAGPVRLGKDTSNLFRDRTQAPPQKLNVRQFNNVLAVNKSDGYVDVEGMTTYKDLVDATLSHGVMPCVVPQLKSITIGGAVSGIGIESSSFKYGLVHESISEMDVLTGNGDVVTCTPDNEYCDLFFGLPNSYGTLGYVLRLRAQTIPVTRFVRLRHLRFEDPIAFFQALERWCRDPGAGLDFIDGTAFSPNELYLSVGNFTSDAPYTSDYTYKQIYYRSIREREEDFLTTRDYLWRWDTDWFWCSKNLFAQNPLIRQLYGRKRLNSIFYTKVMRWNSRWGITRAVDRLLGNHTESVIQDVDIPVERGAEFLEFFDREIGIRPVWICPIGNYSRRTDYPLYPMDPGALYVNFGFWDVVRGRETRPGGYYNRLVEKKVEDLGGIKSLYSDSFYDHDHFWQLYNQKAYQALKSTYDTNRRLKDLYDKCVLRQ